MGLEDNGRVVFLPWHMGAMHPYEKALTLVLAFGPFLLLALVLYLRTRHADQDTEVEVEETQRDR